MCTGGGGGGSRNTLRDVPSSGLRAGGGRPSFLPSLAAINCTRGALITAGEMHTNTLYDVTREKRQICSQITDSKEQQQWSATQKA